MKLGDLSAEFESGSRGTSAIGFDSGGGASYGKYQIAHRVGTLDRFMIFLRDNYLELYMVLK